MRKSPNYSARSSNNFPPRRGNRGNQPHLPGLNAFANHCTDESIAFIQEDINTIIVSLKASTLHDLDSIKRSKSLLETLSSYLISNKSNHSFKFSIDFREQILSLNALLKDISAISKNVTDKATINLLCQVQNLCLKNVRNLLKITNGLKDDAYAVLLEDLLDHLKQIKERICQIDRESNFDTALELDSIACTLLKCTFFISSKGDFSLSEICKKNLCQKFIGILRCFAFYGLENYDLNAMTVDLYPSMINQFLNTSESSTPKNKRGRVDEFELLEDDSLFNTSSAQSSFSTSEYSSSELDDESRRLSRREVQHNKKIYGKMRMLAYESLQSSLSLFGIRYVFGYWSFLFPDAPNLVENTQFSVLLTIAKDPANRVRTSALNFMYNFFNCGKLFVGLTVSEWQSSKSTAAKAFIPFSVSFTSMIKELHRFFEQILLKETNSAILILIYKVVSLIVAITPYNKLNTDILHPLFYRNSFLLDHKVTQIRNLALALYVKMFSPEYLPKEFRQWLVENKTGLEVISKVFKNCFEFIENTDCILLCIESVKLLSSIVKHHGLMVDLFNSEGAVGIDILSISKVSIETIQIERSLTNPVLQSLICKFIHSLAMLFKHVASKDVTIFGAETDKLEFIKSWFLQVFASRIFQLALVDQDMAQVKGATQVTLVNVISLIPEPVFSLIELNTHYHIIAILMALARGEFSEMTFTDQEEDPSIYTKSAAIRCLSIIQSFACLSDDLSLTFDLIDICLDALDRNGNRTKSQKKKEIYLLEHSLWALANICDVIKKNQLEMEVDSALLNRIVKCLLNCYDISRIQFHTDDILVNLVRSSGIVLYIILYKQQQSVPATEEAGDESSPFKPSPSNCEVDQSACFEVVKHLIDLLLTKRLYKLQWNICIALSYLLAQENFIDLCRAYPGVTASVEAEQGGSLLEQIYDALLQKYQSTPNHKVQSYSVFTICSVARLDYLQPRLEQLWPCVVDKFIDDFNKVPVHSQLSWLEKYVFALQRLLDAHVLLQGQQHKVSDQARSSLEELRKFVLTDNEFNADENFAVHLNKLRHVLQSDK